MLLRPLGQEEITIASRDIRYLSDIDIAGLGKDLDKVRRITLYCGTNELRFQHTLRDRQLEIMEQTLWI